jgi:hypothetical protein
MSVEGVLCMNCQEQHWTIWRPNKTKMSRLTVVVEEVPALGRRAVATGRSRRQCRHRRGGGTNVGTGGGEEASVVAEPCNGGGEETSGGGDGADGIDRPRWCGAHAPMA